MRYRMGKALERREVGKFFTSGESGGGLEMEGRKVLWEKEEANCPGGEGVCGE